MAAETHRPLVICLEPAILADWHVSISKIDLEAAQEIEGSRVGVGIVGGVVSSEGEVYPEFTQEDLALALRRYEAQTQL